MGRPEDELAETRAALRGRELELHHALAARDELVGAISHELRTPLTVVTGLSDVLERRVEDLDAASLRHFARRIQHHASRLERMVHDLLDAARRDALDPVRRPVALRAVVEVACRDLRLTDVQVVGRGDVVAMADGNHLRRVVSALLDNARTYGRPPVTVTVGQQGATVSIEVSDTGDGIRPELVDRLFEPFTQADSGDRRTARGVGMGLHVARALVRANGGELELTDPGSRDRDGARFRLRVPASRRPPATEPRAPRWPHDEEAFRLFAALPEPVVVHDGERIRYANEAFLELLGMTTPAQVVGRPAADLVADPRAMVDAFETLASVPPGAPPPTLRVPCRHADGHLVWLATTRRTTMLGGTEHVVVHARPTVPPTTTEGVVRAMGRHHGDLASRVRDVLTAAHEALGTEVGLVGEVRGPTCRVALVEPGLAVLPPGSTWPIDATLCGTVWGDTDGAVLTVPDVARSPWSGHVVREVLGVGAFTAAPVFVGGEPWGSLVLARRSAAPEWAEQQADEVCLLVAAWLGGHLTLASPD